MDELATPITEDMLNQALNFAIGYDVSGKKYEQGRTSGQARGLGGIIDSFVPGKVIELAVCENPARAAILRERPWSHLSDLAITTIGIQ